MSVIAEKRVQTRKPHACFGCMTEYPAGSTLSRVTWKDDDIRSYYWCDVCEALWCENFSYDDEINVGEMRTEDPAAWESMRAELQAKDQP